NLGQPAAPEVTISYLQLPESSPIAHMFMGIAPGFAIQTQGSIEGMSSAIQRVIKEEAPGFAVDGISPMNTAISDHMRARRMALQISSVFGMLALALSMAGIYGVLAYITGQRTREIGIRLALGATRDRVMFFVLRIGLTAIASGLIVGIISGMLASRWIRAYLYGVSLYDPISYL